MKLRNRLLSGSSGFEQGLHALSVFQAVTKLLCGSQNPIAMYSVSTPFVSLLSITATSL